MRERFELGTTVPHDEPCAQLGRPNYHQDSISECLAFIDMLTRTLGDPPAGAYLKRISCSHDFGTYHDVVVVYNPEIEEAEEYALKVESSIPDRWDEESLEILRSRGYTLRG
jgi:hypothetical protein